ncbi:TatD family hydrolase [uncultured Bacteroides sp.]|uniref:TatD family hydrolase n=1 Tax=uncultured Bacteroides sp. TaxID=162156 RepID=UPI00258B4099|nr:TatD family hydrolase [uncultured Bacteroides sp.]
MKIPADIHTHRQPQVPGEAIVNCFPETFVPQAGGWYSVGIHPWRIALSDVTAHFEELLRHPQVLAVGEAGLDKLVEAPLPLQIKIFEFQARLAEEIDKPLVIHLVKAVDELLKLRRRLHPMKPWIIHGFRGKAALAEEYLRHGFYLSFGERYQEEALRIVPPERLFIETDESTMPVGRLYERAAEVREIPLEELRETIRRNVDEIFFRR